MTIVTAIMVTATTLTPSAASASADRRPPSRPGPLTVQSVAQTSAVVQFGRARDNSRGVTYRVLANGKVVRRSSRVTDVRVPLHCGRKYFITAVAVDAAGNRSQPSPGANLRTRACLDVTPPHSPDGLHTTRKRHDLVRLTWLRARDPKHGIVPNYLIYRDGVVLGGSQSRYYTARNLRPSTAYRFSVRARDRAGNLSRPAVLRVTTPPPPQATGNVRAFLLSTDGGSFADAQRHYMRLDWIYPTFFSLTRHGDVTGTGDPRHTSWLQERGIEVMPRFHSEDPAVIEAIAADEETRARAVDTVARTVIGGGYDGANLDLEMNMPTSGIDDLTVEQRWDRLRNGYTLFVEGVAARLHDADKLVSVAVSPNWCSSVNRTTRATEYCTDSSSSSTRRPRAYLFDYRRLAAAADELWVMAWGLHWATSDPGPMADARWLRAVTDYYTDLFTDQPALSAKLTLGTNLYGMDWSYQVVRSDQVTMPGGTIPPAPACPAITKSARPRYTYTGTNESGTLTVDWICLTRYADTAEYDDVVAQRDSFDSQRFDEPAAENVLAGTDLTTPGARREIWFSDARAVAVRSDIATAAGWRLGFWRLGNEDQAIWSLPSVALSRSQP